MCRSIKPLYNFDPPSSPDDVRAAALQFVRKVSGFHKPSQVNAVAFEAAVTAIAAASQSLLESLVTPAPPKNRLIEVGKIQARARLRFPQ
jgi:hypothetical protein